RVGRLAAVLLVWMVACTAAPRSQQSSPAPSPSPPFSQATVPASSPTSTASPSPSPSPSLGKPASPSPKPAAPASTPGPASAARALDARLGRSRRPARRQRLGQHLHLPYLQVADAVRGPVRLEPSGVGRAGGKSLPRAMALGVGGRRRHHGRLPRPGRRRVAPPHP